MSAPGAELDVREELDLLLPELYDELRRIARRTMRDERSGHTLQPTALIHEAYVRLSEQSRVPWSNRRQILAAATRVMRRILVDHARAKRTEKRGSGADEVPLADDLVAGVDGIDVDVVALDEALTRLAAVDPDLVRVVELRFFGGLTIEETAESMEISTATVKREWAMAKAWLFRELASSEPEEEPH